MSQDSQSSLKKILLSKRILPFFFWEFFNTWAPWMSLIVVYFNKHLNLSYTQILLLQSIYMYSTAMLEVPTGILGDRVGRKYSILIGNALYMLGFTAYTFKLPFVFYMLAEFLMGMGLAFESGSNEALIYDTFKELRAERYYQKFLSANRIVGLVSNLVSGTFAIFAIRNGISLRFLWTTTPITLLLSLGILTFFIQEPKIELKESLVPDYKEYLKSALSTIKQSAILRIIVVFSLLFGLSRYLLQWAVQPLFLYFNIDIKHYPLIFSIGIPILSIAVHQILLTIKKNIKFSKLVRLLLSNQFIFIIFLLTANSLHLKTLITINYVAYRIILVELSQLINAFMQPYIKSFNRATVLSGISFIRTLLFATVNIVWGTLLDINVMWAVLGALTLLYAVIEFINYKYKNIIANV